MRLEWTNRERKKKKKKNGLCDWKRLVVVSVVAIVVVVDGRGCVDKRAKVHTTAQTARSARLPANAWHRVVAAHREALQRSRSHHRESQEDQARGGTLMDHIFHIFQQHFIHSFISVSVLSWITSLVRPSRPKVTSRRRLCSIRARAWRRPPIGPTTPNSSRRTISYI